MTERVGTKASAEGLAQKPEASDVVVGAEMDLGSSKPESGAFGAGHQQRMGSSMRRIGENHRRRRELPNGDKELIESVPAPVKDWAQGVDGKDWKNYHEEVSEMGKDGDREEADPQTTDIGNPQEVNKSGDISSLGESIFDSNERRIQGDHQKKNQDPFWADQTPGDWFSTPLKERRNEEEGDREEADPQTTDIGNPQEVNKLGDILSLGESIRDNYWLREGFLTSLKEWRNKFEVKIEEGFREFEKGKVDIERASLTEISAIILKVGAKRIGRGDKLDIPDEIVKAVTDKLNKEGRKGPNDLVPPGVERGFSANVEREGVPLISSLQESNKGESTSKGERKGAPWISSLRESNRRTRVERLMIETLKEVPIDIAGEEEEEIGGLAVIFGIFSEDKNLSEILLTWRTGRKKWRFQNQAPRVANRGEKADPEFLFLGGDGREGDSSGINPEE